MEATQIPGYRNINSLSLQFLKEDYLLPGQSLDERVNIIMERFEKLGGSRERRLKFEQYFREGYYSLSTPVWTNYGTTRGLPISCFGTYISDSMESILYGIGEVGMMSKFGGGTSAFLDVRPRGAAIKDNGTSAGPFGFEKLYDTLSTTVSQGATRRGALAMYMDLSHPDIMEHLSIREENNPIQDLSFGVTVSDEWMEAMIEGDKEKRKIWAKVISVRNNTGYPYIVFSGNANNNTSEVYKQTGHKIKASNLCSEIMLPSDDTESFICCLASMNVLYYDEWKNTDAVEMLTYFLDTVIEDFILNLEGRISKLKANSDQFNIPYVSFMERPLRFAKRHRAIGIGVLGLASLYQAKMLAWSDLEAAQLNSDIFKFIQDRSGIASKEMAILFGEPEVCKGTGYRNSCLQAVAPTKSSSFIHGQVSEGIEPYRTNVYVKDLAKIKVIFRNPYLKAVLETYGKDDRETWLSIEARGGSVQHISFLTEREKEIFKTFQEINPKVVVSQAAARQQFIDQSQSLNLILNVKDTPVKDVNALMIEAWESGVKSLYYLHNVNAAQEFARDFITCSSCQA